MRVKSLSRWHRAIGVALACCGLAAPALAERAATQARAAALGRDQAAAGWLQLEQDQGAARRAAAPMAPGPSPGRQVQEQQQALDLRRMLQDQQRARDAAAAAARRAPAPSALPPGQAARALGLGLRQGRDLEGLRMRRGLDPGGAGAR